MDMVGWLSETERRGWRVAVTWETVEGVTLCRADCPVGRRTSQRARQRRLRRAARLLLQRGCRRVLTTPDFDGWATLEAAGLRRVEPGPLCGALAARLALAWLERAAIPPERATVALVGRRVDRDLFEAAAALAPRVRRLAVEVPGEGAELLRCLAEEYGLPALEGRAGADVTLCFPGAAGEGSGALMLWGSRPDLDGLVLTAGDRVLPGELDPLPLLQILWEHGVLLGAEVGIRPGVSGQIT